MKDSPSILPVLGSGFLKPGENVIHFYYSGAEQARFTPFLQEGLEHGMGVVIAGVGDHHPALMPGVRAPRLQRRRNLLRLQVTQNLRASIATVTQAASALLAWTREVRIVVDFDGMVSRESIFENEAELSQALRGKRVTVISQYDGNAFPAAITMEQFQTHAVTVVGNAFYSENRNYVAPEEYLRARRRKTHAAARVASA